VPAAGSKYTFFDTIRAAGVDVMQIAPRASTHLDWTHFAAANPFGPSIDHGVYGEMVATYYTLAWLDRYVAPSSAAPSRKAERQSKAKAREALRRLTATGTDRFDRSADVHSIGAGFFDADKAKKARNPEAGMCRSRSVGCPSGTCCPSSTTPDTSSTAERCNAKTCEPAARDHATTRRPHRFGCVAYRDCRPPKLLIGTRAIQELSSPEGGADPAATGFFAVGRQSPHAPYRYWVVTATQPTSSSAS
jgi:hypothetical protein